VFHKLSTLFLLLLHNAQFKRSGIITHSKILLYIYIQ